MFFVFGSRLMGKVDEVPGLFHVATKFWHINFLPLVPMQSYVILGKNGGSFRGVPIPMSGKSVLAAWGRSIGVLAALIGGIFALVAFTNPRGPDQEAFLLLGVAVFGGAGAAFTWFYRGFTRASFDRACHLGRLIGLNEQGMNMICQAYGQVGGRGFEVTPIAPPPANPYVGQAYPSPQGFDPRAYPSSGYNSAPQPGQQPTYPAPAYPQAAYPAVDAAPSAEPYDVAPQPQQVGIPPAPSFNTPATFFVTGVNRATGETTCVTIWADTAEAAKAMGQSRGIEVQQVDFAGPRPG